MQDLLQAAGGMLTLTWLTDGWAGNHPLSQLPLDVAQATLLVALATILIEYMGEVLDTQRDKLFWLQEP